MRRALADETTFLGAAPAGGEGDALLRHAIDVTRERFGPAQLVELGIGCESCHGGSREHATDPSLRPSYAPLAPWIAVTPARPHELTRAEQINHVCARCHQVLFSHYPWTWEGGRRRALAGGSSISSGEGRDFLLGGCASAMSCTRCHDPHGGAARTAGLDTPAGNGVCTGCHEALRAPAAQRAHSHHAPDGKAGACIACHMPKKNMSLDVGLTRYHRIGSPTDPMRVLGDRPLECALCHADKTVGELVVTMERWWNKSYDRDALAKLYGPLDARTMMATLERGKPHEQAVALFVLGQNRERAAAPAIARALAVDLPLVRQYARDALDLSLGKPCPVRL
jgi:predicted CXXCH cytochrome family protein